MRGNNPTLPKKCFMWCGHECCECYTDGNVFQNETKINMVRAKFKCEAVNSDTNGSEGKSIALSAVTSGSEENDSFFKWTPAGTVYLSIVNPDAASKFEAGKEYYVDFTPVA